MAKLLEVEYDKIFSPNTMAALKGKSGESLRQMVGNRPLMQTMMRSKEVLDQIIAAEEGYRDELEAIAIQMVTDAYPIIDYANIKIIASIGNDMDIEMNPNNEDPSQPDFGEDDPEKMKAEHDRELLEKNKKINDTENRIRQKEQLNANRIFRPTQIYTGQHDVPYTPIEQRS